MASVPTRDVFTRVVLYRFSNADPRSNCEVMQWVCSQEAHREETSRQASLARRNAACSNENEGCSDRKAKRRKKYLTVYDVSQIAVQKGIKSRPELLALAN